MISGQARHSGPRQRGGGDAQPPQCGGGDAQPPQRGGGDAQPPQRGGRDAQPPRRRRSRLPWPLRNRPVRIAAVLLILALITEYLVIPELVDASRDLYLLGRIGVAWVIAGAVLEAVSLYCYALMNRALLPGRSPPMSRLFRIDLTGAAVGHVIPAGTAGSAGIGYSLFIAEGVPGPVTAVMMATKGIGSAVVLNVLLWLSLVISIPLAGFHPIYVTVAALGVVAVGGVSGLVLAFTLGKHSAARIVRAIGKVIPGVGGDRLAAGVHRLSDYLVALGRDRRMLARAVIWASANWLIDAASLWCFVAAFGRFANPVELFAAYGIANVLAVLPFTPAGLGVIDSITPILLVSFGLTRSVATLGVLAWRLVNFWLPIPAGAVAYVTLKLPRGARLRSSRRAWSELLARTARNGQQPQPETSAVPARSGIFTGKDEGRATAAGAREETSRTAASLMGGSFVFEADDIREWRGYRVVDVEKSKIGDLEAIYVNTKNDQPSFATVKVGMLKSTRLVFVPLAGATVGPGYLKVAYPKGLVRDAPSIGTDGELLATDEAAVFAHYDLPYSAGETERLLARR